MALTPLRWIAALVAGCLIIAVPILREDPPLVGDTGMERRLSDEMDWHARHASALAGRLRTVQVVDSTGAGNGAPGAPPFRLLHDAALPADVRVVLDSVARMALRPLRDSARVGIDLFFLNDTVTAVRGAITPHYGTYPDYVLPQRADQRCAVIVRVRSDLKSRLRTAAFPRAAAEQLLGPCLFYGAFGLPGAQVNRWLRDRGWAFIGQGSWSERVTPMDLHARMVEEQWIPFKAMIGTETTIPFISEMNIDGLHCAEGAAGSCDQMLLAKRPQGQGPAVFNGNVLYRSYPPLGRSEDYGYVYYRRGFGRREPFLLNDMVRTLGRDRFARFWTSGDPVPSAFATAAGEPLSAWTTRWMTEQYGAVPPRGAGVSPSGAGASILLIVLAVLVALRVSSRRQFA